MNSRGKLFATSYAQVNTQLTRNTAVVNARNALFRCHCKYKKIREFTSVNLYKKCEIIITRVLWINKKEKNGGDKEKQQLESYNIFTCNYHFNLVCIEQLTRPKTDHFENLFMRHWYVSDDRSAIWLDVIFSPYESLTSLCRPIVHQNWFCVNVINIVPVYGNKFGWKFTMDESSCFVLDKLLRNASRNSFPANWIKKLNYIRLFHLRKLRMTWNRYNYY